MPKLKKKSVETRLREQRERKRNSGETYRSRAKAGLTEEELAAYRAKQAEAARKYRARLSGDELSRRRAVEAEKKRQQRAKLTPEQLIVLRAKETEVARLQRLRRKSEKDGETLNEEEPDENSSNENLLLEIQQLRVRVRALKKAGLEIVKTRVAAAVKDLLGPSLNSGKDQKIAVPKKVRSKKGGQGKSGELLACTVCPQKFRSKVRLCSHMKKHTLKSKHGSEETAEGELNEKVPKGSKSARSPKIAYQCEVCPEKLPTIVKYRDHLIESHKDNTELIKKKCFSCPFCKDVCNTKKNLTWHFRDIHEIYVQCPICDEYIKTQELFTEHVNVSHSKLSISDTILQHSDLYVCKVCGIAQNSYNSITKHFQNLHSEVRCFQCDICGKAFATEFSKKAHTIKSHSEKTFICENCGKTYRDISAFKRHVRTHDNGGPQNQPRVPCMVPGCAKTFVNKNSCRKHFLEVHKNERNFLCPVCGKVFNSSASLSLHKVNVCEKDKAKKVPCPVCGKVLDNFYLLSYHKNNFHRYGNTEETFCHRCNKDYSSSFALYSHNNHAHRNKDKDTEHVKPRIPKKRKNTNRAPSYTSESGDYVDFSQANVHESLMKSARENNNRSTEVATSSLAAQSMYLGFW